MDVVMGSKRYALWAANPRAAYRPPGGIHGMYGNMVGNQQECLTKVELVEIDDFMRMQIHPPMGCVKMCLIGPKLIIILLYNVEFNFEESLIIFG
jgi:hypothetical protein